MGSATASIDSKNGQKSNTFSCPDYHFYQIKSPSSLTAGKTFELVDGTKVTEFLVDTSPTYNREDDTWTMWIVIAGQRSKINLYEYSVYKPFNLGWLNNGKYIRFQS